MSPVEERIKVLRERFTESLPDRIAEIRRTWMRMNAQSGNAGLREQFTRQLHTLGGTAGTYGLHDVAALAIDGEHACEDLGGPEESMTLAYLGTLMEDIGVVTDAWLGSAEVSQP